MEETGALRGGRPRRLGVIDCGTETAVLDIALQNAYQTARFPNIALWRCIYGARHRRGLRR